MTRKQLNKIVETQRPLLINYYEVEFIHGKVKLFSFGYFAPFKIVEFISYFVLFVGISTVTFVNFSENPLVSKVDAASVLENTTTQLNGELNQTSIPLDTINASISRIDYAIQVAKAENMKEYFGKSKVEYISELITLRSILADMKLTYGTGKGIDSMSSEAKLKAVMIGLSK